MSAKDREEGEPDEVVIQHRILQLPECFVYRIPPMKSADGHRADDWNLATPLATCALDMSQMDDSLIIKLLGNRPKKDGPTGATEQMLFAQSKINLNVTGSSPPIQYWVEPVTDSSRYFVLRISDEKRKREAHIGIGFRDRDDATSFRMGMQEYEQSIQRERIVQDMKSKQCDDSNGEPNSNNQNGTQSIENSVSRLSLKDGEKIHVNLKTTTNRRKRSNSGKGTVGKGGLLLKRPPVTVETTTQNNSSDKHGSQGVSTSESTVDEDEWGDFQ